MKDQVSEPEDLRTYRVENQQSVQGQVVGDVNTVYNYYGPIYSSLSPSQEEREQRLRLLLTDHSSFLRDRLSALLVVKASWRHRPTDLKKRLTGGYVTITGQAGQGKSSIIAKLVHDAGR